MKIEIRDDDTIIYNGDIYRREGVYSKEKIFLELFTGLSLRENREKYPDSVFGVTKRSQVMFECDEKNKRFKVDDSIWKIVTGFGMDYDEASEFIGDMARRYFNFVGAKGCGLTLRDSQGLNWLHLYDLKDYKPKEK